jgi:hypothetical protein
MVRGFSHVMVHHDAGRNFKVVRLTAAEKCAWVFGVLPIAGKARMRGAFMVGERAATAEDVAAQSGESKRTAVSLLSKMRALGMLELDPEIGAEWIHDFEEHNPEPKVDATTRERSKRYRERQKSKRHADSVTGATESSRRDGRDDHGGDTPPEVEGEVEDEKRSDAGERARIAAGVAAGAVHPDLPTVMALLTDLPPDKALNVDEGAVHNCLLGHRDGDAVQAAHRVVSWALEGEMRTRSASNALHTIFDKQRTEAEVRAKQVQRAGERPVYPARSGGSRKLSAAEEADALLAEADRLAALEHDERNAA